MLEEIERELKQGKNFEDIIKLHGWKTLEDFVEALLKLHGWEVKRNFKLKKYEIDILAKKLGQVLCLECKCWGKGRYKLSSLKKESEKLLLKAKSLEAELKLKVLPLMITLHEEGIVEHHGVIFIPAWKLNSFLLSLV